MFSVWDDHDIDSQELINILKQFVNYFYQTIEREILIWSQTVKPIEKVFFPSKLDFVSRRLLKNVSDIALVKLG